MRKKAHTSEMGLLLMRDLLTWTLCTQEVKAAFLNEIYPVDKLAERKDLVLNELWYLMLSLVYCLTPINIESRELRESVIKSLDCEMHRIISGMDQSFLPIIKIRLECYSKALGQKTFLKNTVRLFRYYIDGMIVKRDDFPHLRKCPRLDTVIPWIIPSAHLELSVARMIEAIIEVIQTFIKNLKIYE